VYFDFTYEGSTGWSPSRVKLVTKTPKTEYTVRFLLVYRFWNVDAFMQFGSDDGNYGHPDGDFNDTLVTTIIS